MPLKCIIKYFYLLNGKDSSFRNTHSIASLNYFHAMQHFTYFASIIYYINLKNENTYEIKTNLILSVIHIKQIELHAQNHSLFASTSGGIGGSYLYAIKLM